MNSTLKHWREAATLILTAGTQHGNIIPKIQHLPRPQKPAFDYEVLLLKRSASSGFMPNAFVFPGGLVDTSDFSNDWVKVFERFKHRPNFGLGLVKQHPSTRPPIFATDRAEFGSLIPGEVAFRICAIRETFEESGVLLVVPEDSNIEDNQNFLEMDDHDEGALDKWRLEVQKNPFQFIQMCKEMRCVPNIWALHEWANWLTPTFSRGSKSRRYDTAFFICSLQKKPHATGDQKEVVSFQWWTPPDALEECRSQKIWIPPPQFYELSRLCRQSSIHELHRFCLDRALEGCERWMPVFIHAEDGIVNVLPGDDLYPEEPDWTGEKKRILSTIEKIKDLVREDHRLHRVLQQDGVPAIYVNTKPKYKHIHPLTMATCHGGEPRSQL
ncbi:hypothetical protein FKM82_003819 [Ascaphus truei]